MADFNNNDPNNLFNNYSGNYNQQYTQNPNNIYNNNYNNNNNPYNNYPNNINPQNSYIPPQPVKTGSSRLLYIILIAVIIFFAVIIVLMSTAIRAMFNKDNNQPEGNVRNNTISSETQQKTTQEQTTEVQTTEKLTTTTTKQTTTTTTAEPIPETVTVTVIVEVEKEIIKEVPAETPVQNDYTEVYSGVYYACVTTKSSPLNIRSGAGESYKILGSIPKGKYIDVKMTSNSNWYYTTYNGVSGYINSAYITLILSGEFYGYDDNYNGYYSSYEDDYDNIDGDGHNGDWATVATNSDPLNLRSSASTNGSIITAIPKGSSVYVNYQYDDTWCYITWGNYSGYVAMQYLAF
ncbi:MAG: SH3 domain-containing protein [Ruminococcus sp.]|nr:SH3 domain-containing protein [Ruminococcus sp.]